MRSLLVLLLPLLSQAPCRPQEILTLWNLYEATGGAQWKQNTNWAPDGDPCHFSKRWVGVGAKDPCDRWKDGETCALGRITALTLEDNNLNGSLSSWTDVKHLRNLTLIELAHNSIAGTLPTQLGRLSNLVRFQMPHNSLQGTLPTELGDINRPAFVKDLTEMLFADNSLSGTLPSELAAHTRLEAIDLRLNRLSGSLPPQLATLSALSLFKIQNNPSLSGTLPSPLSAMAELSFLDGSRTRLSGTLPPSLGSLPRLWTLNLEAAALSGTIPSELTDVYMLRNLRLSDNRLTGNLPAAVGKLQNLQLLDVYNNSMTGDVPTSIRELINLEALYLANEHLLPLRKRYCGQRLPDLGKYSWLVVREQYDQMMESYCPPERLYDTSYTFSSLQESNAYDM